MATSVRAKFSMEFIAIKRERPESASGLEKQSESGSAAQAFVEELPSLHLFEDEPPRPSEPKFVDAAVRDMKYIFSSVSS